MKLRALLVVLASCSWGALPVAAASPEVIRFQGVVSELGGQAVADGTYQFLVEMFDQATGGALVYSQTVSAAVSEGAYVLVVSPALPGELTAVFRDSPRFLQITVQSGPGGPIGQMLTPRQEIASVPYALGGAVPSGAIILWDSPTGCNGVAAACPCDYSEVTALRGLSIRGADSASSNPEIPDVAGAVCSGAAPCGGPGSAYDDLLSTGELASHQHLGLGAGNADNWPDGSEQGGTATHRGTGNTTNNALRYNSSVVGSSQPHYHPFGTVLFCRRD